MHLPCLQQTESAAGMCLFSDGYLSSLQNTAYCFNNKQEKKAAKSPFPPLYITIYFTAQLLAAGAVTIRLRESHSWKKKTTAKRTLQGCTIKCSDIKLCWDKLASNSLIPGTFKWLLSIVQELWGKGRKVVATLTAHPSLPSQS